MNLKKNHQRLLLICEGSREWCQSLLYSGGIFKDYLLLSDIKDLPDAVTFSSAENYLGLEYHCVIYDQFSGLNIDVLSMAAGLVRAGGLLLLWRPQDLQRVNDRYGQWQEGQNTGNYFQQYLDRHFQQSDAVVWLRQHARPEPVKKLFDASMVSIEEDVTSGQAQILESLRRWMEDEKKPVFLLTAERGRGKSFTLGLFINQCTKALQIIVTAASKAQASIVLQHIDASREQVRFMAPDEIIRRQQLIDCLVIDEAAMLPNSMLQACIELSDKAVLATTTGGYEGTGQGFMLKFLARMDSAKYEHQRLYDPVRWGEKDLLEKFFNETLFFTPKQCELPLAKDSVIISEVSKRQFSDDESLLKSVYGLLVSAHYRTRPSDLRQLMDDENQRIVIASNGQDKVGVLLLNREGGLKPEICRDIFLGTRRPKGHLFAQMITAQAGIQDFAGYQGYRVQRITVAQDYRMQGVGRKLIQEAGRLIEEEKLDYLSSTFALDSTMALFWSKLGFELLHISSGKGKSTGRQSVAVIQTNREKVRQHVQPLIDRLNDQLALYLLSYCNKVLWQEVRVLLQMLKIRYPLTTLERDEIIAFGEGFRGLELSQITLQRLLISTLHENTGLGDDRQRLLIEKILLNKSWRQVKTVTGDIGRKLLMRDLRQSIRICYEIYKTAQTH